MKKALTVLLYFLVFIVLQISVSSAVAQVVKIFWPKTDLQSPQLLLWLVAAASILTIVIFLVARWCRVSRNYIRSRPWAELAWTACLAVGMIIPLAWIEEQLPAAWHKDLMEAEMTAMLRTTEGYFVICMLAPLMEEIVFRGAIARAAYEWFSHLFDSRWSEDMSMTEWTDRKHTVERRARWVAILLSAALFAIAHFNPAQIPHALIVGILLGWLYFKTGSIVPGLLIHWINNSAGYALINLFPTMPSSASLADYVGGNQWAVARAVVCSLLICLPALYQLARKRRGKGDAATMSQPTREER